MRKKRSQRNWNKQNPLTCFKEQYGNRKITRSQLENEDSRLYDALWRRGLLDKAIPEKFGVTYRGYASPLECFKALYGNKKITRGQLKNEDGGLYATLWKRGLLDKAIPNKVRRDYNGNPLAYFRKHYGNRKITRWQLSTEDSGLYATLWRRGLLDKAIPNNYPNTTKLLEDIAGA